MNSIGPNIDAQKVDDRAHMYGWLVEAKPRLIVVMNEQDVATRCKMVVPSANVVHRWVYEGDDSIDRYTPQAWAAQFLANRPANTYTYCLNEPGGDWRAQSNWMVATMAQAAVMNAPLCIGNHSKGNPPVEAINAGEFDDFLLAFNDFPLHRYGVHLYWKTTPENDPDTVHYRYMRDRARKIGAQVRFMATEAGRDELGGYDDGWRNHHSEPEYAELLVRQARMLADDGVDMAVFVYGA